MPGWRRSHASKIIVHYLFRSCGRGSRRFDCEVRLLEVHSLECSSLLLSSDSGVPSSDNIGGIVSCLVVIPEFTSWAGSGRASWLSVFMEVVVSSD